jgi:hypothetical protein
MPALAAASAEVGVVGDDRDASIRSDSGRRFD